MVYYTDSFVLSITSFEEDWHLSQGQQEVLLAEVTLMNRQLHEAVVGVDINIAQLAVPVYQFYLLLRV